SQATFKARDLPLCHSVPIATILACFTITVDKARAGLFTQHTENVSAPIRNGVLIGSIELQISNILFQHPTMSLRSGTSMRYIWASGLFGESPNLSAQYRRNELLHLELRCRS
ncbi:unnamed protein product, partial [Fusarium graminearum]